MMLDFPEQPEFDEYGMGTAGITDQDELAVQVGDSAIVMSLTPKIARELARALQRCAKRLEKKAHRR